jgi:hypothetical protein
MRLYATGNGAVRVAVPKSCPSRVTATVGTESRLTLFRALAPSRDGQSGSLRVASVPPLRAYPGVVAGHQRSGSRKTIQTTGPARAAQALTQSAVLVDQRSECLTGVLILDWVGSDPGFSWRLSCLVRGPG